MCRQRTVTVRARKAPWMGIEDTPGRIAAMVDITGDDQPATFLAIHPKEVSSQGPSIASANSSSHREESAQIKEELSLILTGVLPPSYKELVSASVYLAPPRFHESVRCYPQRKLTG